MSHKVPKNPQWCIRCNFPIPYGYDEGQPCEKHRAADGSPCEYTGEDAYEPSAWAEEVVGKLYKAYDDFIYEAIGYDPRSGVIVERVGVEPCDKRKASISERAIGFLAYWLVTLGAAVWLAMEDHAIFAFVVLVAGTSFWHGREAKDASK